MENPNKDINETEDFGEIDDEDRMFYTMIFGTDLDEDLQREKEQNKKVSKS